MKLKRAVAPLWPPATGNVLPSARRCETGLNCTDGHFASPPSSTTSTTEYMTSTRRAALNPTVFAPSQHPDLLTSLLCCPTRLLYSSERRRPVHPPSHLTVTRPSASSLGEPHLPFLTCTTVSSRPSYNPPKSSEQISGLSTTRIPTPASTPVPHHK